MRRLKLTAGLLVLGLVATAAAQLARWSADRRKAQQAWRELLKPGVPLPERFDSTLVADLPEPARRFFNFAIQPGTRLSTIIEISMQGELSLGSRADPKYQPMRAEQLLAPPHGLVWRVDVGQGAVRLSGSDAMVEDRSWTRFWLLRLIPSVRVGGDRDHLRSSFGRVVAEAVFWAPAFLLPRAGVSWTAVDQDTARATVMHGGLSQEVDVRVDATGRPVWVSMPRWTNANSQNIFRVQPFGGELGDFREVSGYRLPFRVDGGNFFGTPDYFPFYRARVDRIQVR